MFEEFLTSNLPGLLGFFTVFGKRSNLGWDIPNGDQCLANLPVWTQNVIEELNRNLFYRFHSAVNNARSSKSPYAFGYMIGMSKRIFIFIFRELEKTQGTFWNELFNSEDIPEDLTRQEERMVNLIIILGLCRFRRNPDKSKEFVIKPIYRLIVLLQSWQEFCPDHPYDLAFKNLLLAADQASLSYDSMEQERYLEGVADGYRAFLNGSGWFTNDRGRGRTYFTMLLHWQTIEELRLSENPPTFESFYDTLTEWYGHPLNQRKDQLRPHAIKALSATCQKIKLNLAKGGKPKKGKNKLTTKRKKS